MNLDSLSLALSQISYLVANLNKKNYKSSVTEVSYLVQQHGLETDRHLLRCLFSHVDFSCGDSKGSGKDFQAQLLIQECASLVSKSNFTTLLCFAVSNPLHYQKTLRPSPQLFSQISKTLKLSRVQELVFGLALRHSSVPEIQILATQFVKLKLPDLIRSYVDPDLSQEVGGLTDISIEVLHSLLSYLLQVGRDKSAAVTGVSPPQRDTFLATLRKEFPRDRLPVILAPLLYSSDEDITMERLMSDNLNVPKGTTDSLLADALQELGYGCCQSMEECRKTLMQLGVQNLTPLSIAMVLGMMARTHTGLSDDSMSVQLLTGSNTWSDGKDKSDQSTSTTWNAELFIEAVRDLAPHINFRDVILALDHPGFILKDVQGLRLLKQALLRGLQDMFPIEVLYRIWKNTEGQLSWIQQILSNPDVFCFADYPFHGVVVEILKALPEEDNREIANWKSMELTETLLTTSEMGKYDQVKALFAFPIKHCPDMLLLSLLQCGVSSLPSVDTQPKWTSLRHELISILIPIFLGNHPNSSIVLQYAWLGNSQSPSVRQIIMHSMAEWYMRGESDQARLSRILDVAQDLKALSLLLSGTPFKFVIDLACLASRREYLKLDKWITDKIREHGELFVQACVVFLKRRAPQVLGISEKDVGNYKQGSLPLETVGTMLACLQAAAGTVAPDISEQIMNMVANCSNLLKSRPPPGVMKPQPSPGINQQPGFPSLGQAFASQMDPLAGMQSLNLGGNTTPTSSVGMGTFPQQSMMSLFNASQSPPKPFPNLPPVLGGSALPNNNQHQMRTNSNMMPTPANKPARQGDIASIWPELNQTFSQEIDDEANSYFQKIYNQPPNPSMSVEEVIEMLKNFKDSAVKKEREVFMCMLRNLFEEYKFFPQYPDRELHITACLFGGIIEQALVTYIALGIALRYVLEALRKPHGSKMYYFGIAALDKFKTRLKDYPQYCQHLASIPHFEQYPETLIEYIRYGEQQREPPSRSQTGTTTPSTPTVTTVTSTTTGSTKTTTTIATATTTTAVTTKSTKHVPPSIANTTNINTLLVARKDEPKEPPENIQDKIAFIFNNLSQSNMTIKAEDIKESVAEYKQWIAQYMVMKRASIEFNFHSLYSSFVDTLKMPDFSNMVINETLRNIEVLLASDKSDSNFSDRSLLKNLGHWLGMLTLAKNKPILQINIDLKELLLEAYHNERSELELLYVVPFVAKIIESCVKSKVFKPPNPWTMAVMGVLAELHQEPDLKLNLKFEVEVLCKHLSLDINEVPITGYLKEGERLLNFKPKLSGRRKHKDESSTLPPTVSDTPVAPTPSTAVAPATSGTTPTTSSTIAQPQFNFQDLNTSSLSGLYAHITINSQAEVFQIVPQLRLCVRLAVERSVQELVQPVVERSIKIALTTCEQIVKKDFALDPEENRIRLAAHHMVRNLTAGMAMITCREPLLLSISNNFKSVCLTTLKAATPQQKEAIEQAASMVAADNVELACAFIQKCAVEKAVPEMDRRLATEIELRKHARNEGRRYCDPVVLTYQAERMPEQIRLKVGGVTPTQIAVYEEFARVIPGFLPTTESAQPVQQSYALDEITQIYDKCATEIEQHIQHVSMIAPNNQHLHVMELLLEAVVLARNSREIVTALSLLQKAVEGLMEGYIPLSLDPEIAMRYQNTHLLVLKALQDQRAYGPQWTNKQVTRMVCEHRGEQKYNLDAIEALLRAHLITLQAYDLHIAQSMDNGMNPTSVTYAMNIAKRFLIDDKQSNILNEADLYNTLQVLARIAAHSSNPPDMPGPFAGRLAHLIELVRQNHDPAFLDKAPGGPTSMMHSGISQAREFDDPPGLQDKTEYLLREWVNMYHSPAGGRDSTKAFSAFVNQMHQQGILKTDDLITRFFRICTELCVKLCYHALSEQAHTATLTRSKCFHTLDAFVRLIALLVKHSGDAANSVTKINLLNKVLGIVAGVLLHDHEKRGSDFQQLPYHRIFIMLLLELNAPEHVLETINFQVMTAFCNAFHVLRPSKAPGFVYSWLELISHRIFIARMLATMPQQKQGWPMYAQLLIDIFKFVTPFLRNADLSKHVSLLYKGTLRLLLVLLHDFPEFLCDYHYGFCDVIPPNCIQMRNLILSAFPRNMRLPDPFTPNLKVDMLSDITQPPRILTNFAAMIQPVTFKKELDSYIKTRSPVTFLSELRGHLQVSHEPGQRYNVPLMNALVLYVGSQAIAYIHSKGSTPSMNTITHSSHMDIFQNLAVDLDTEGRYLFLNAVANQLRYPNSHTHYFSCTLLYLFAEANSEAIQEQITRVLLERLIVNRPHPWGLLITFIELIRNPSFKFWGHDFVHCAPEIEKLFDTVARSCMQQKQASTTNQANSPS
ncbi:CCR4-NOT transcription complex subunit 1-like isoform X3 [Anneissia japonica]|uniref:CCR4-NOT transcription complex subunit 1-like isoform X3 n=1 Tax=Anneissia japonica TaxID=1529436 RepID=UPI001425870D|nr:CCR4-NOT transcription complex subunit 1-like isoform X3 [Anneissia japonica]